MYVITHDLYRFEPYLRHAIHECIAQDNRHYVVDVDRGQREFFVSIYNLPRVERIRNMRTDKIGVYLSHLNTRVVDSYTVNNPVT
jgi:DNA replicative helicase MCM subunit Mcm2 (Cdc46/Mcm family)